MFLSGSTSICIVILGSDEDSPDNFSNVLSRRKGTNKSYPIASEIVQIFLIDKSSFDNQFHNVCFDTPIFWLIRNLIYLFD